MAKSPLLPRLMACIKENERAAFEKWVEMETVDQASAHVIWFRALWEKLAQHGFPSTVSQEQLNQWWAETFPGRPVAHRGMANLNLTLARITENFIAYQENKKLKARKHSGLLYGLLQRGDKRLFVSYLKNAKQAYQSYSIDRVDYQYFAGWKELLNIEKEWHFYHKDKWYRGYEAHNQAMEDQVFSLASVMATIEVNLGRIEKPEQLSFVERETYRMLPHILDIAPDYAKVIYQMFLWNSVPEIPSQQDLQRCVNLLMGEYDRIRSDLAASLTILLQNLIKKWERSAVNAPYVLTYRAELYHQLMTRKFLVMSKNHFHNLTKIHFQAITLKHPRLRFSLDEERNDQVAPLLQSAYRFLERSIHDLPQDHREHAYFLLKAHYFFETEDNASLDEVFAQLAFTASPDKIYETSLRWLQTKYLFLRDNRAPDLIDVLDRNIQYVRRNGVNSIYASFFVGMEQAFKAIRALATADPSTDNRESLRQMILDSEHLEDRIWLSQMALVD